MDENAALVVNQSGLPDAEIQHLIEERWVELSAFNPAAGTVNPRQVRPQGLFVRSDYQPPTNPIEEMELAIRLAEEDDDVADTIGMMAAVAFNGMKNLHVDEKTQRTFNAISYELNMDLLLREMYQGLLTTAQVYQLTLFSRQSVPNFKSGPDPTLVVPMSTFLNPLTIRVASNSDFGDPLLVQSVDQETHDMLTKFYDPKTTAGERNKIRQAAPVATSLYVAPYVPDVTSSSMDDTLASVTNGWYLNPTMVSRYTLTKNTSQSNYAPLLMRRVFGLCEAKRLLNMMDWALLQGGINFLILVRKGSDKMPAHPLEMSALNDTVKRASKSGVMVGDHRLQVDVMMPNMEALLDPAKRGLLGRKIAKALLRLPDIEFGRVEGGGTPEAEIVSQVLMSDRLLIKRAIERTLYSEIVRRNPGELNKGSAKLWFPPVTISGAKFFNDQLLKLRDRGDISRTTFVEMVGLDAEMEMAMREREIKAGFDKVMIAQNVPSTGDNPMNNGRPPREEQNPPTG